MRPRLGAARTGVIWDLLRDVLSGAGDRLDVVDAGGGTGGFAVPLAGLGHTVTVVDPSPNSLAALERRADEAGVAVRAIQGDAADLRELLEPDCADLVVCHSVLEYVEDPGTALTAVRDILRPGGTVSILVNNHVADSLHRALSGHFDEAREMLTGSVGASPRGFTPEEMTDLLTRAGLLPGAAHGIRVFADLVPSELLDAEPRAVESLIALERLAATHPVLSGIATQLHVFGVK